MTAKSTDSVLSRNPSIQKPLQPVRSKYHQIFREQEALGPFRGYSPEQRIQANARYAEELKREVAQRFSYSSFFVRGDQKDGARFKDIFKRFFASARGGVPWKEKASKVLADKFRGYSDICSVYEVELSEPIRYSGSGDYGSGGYTVTHTTDIGPSPEFIQELESLIKGCYGLKEEFLSILQANRLKLGDTVKLDHRDVSFATYLDKPQYPNLQEIEANNAIPREQRQPLPRPQMKFFLKHYLLQALSTIYPKCTDKLNEIFTLLLEIKWLEHDNNQIKVYLGQGKNIPKGIGYGDIKGFIDIQGSIYAVKKTLGDGACGLHALLGDPIYGEYRYSGPQNVREVFVERLEEKITNQDIRLLLKNILKAHISATEDPSSRMIFEGDQGLALRQEYEWARNQYESYLLRLKQDEAFFWKDQLDFPPIRSKLLEEARNSSRYRHKSDWQILEMLRETPSLISTLIDADRVSFLQRLEPCYRGYIFRIIYEKQDLSQYREAAEDLFVLNHVYPQYIQVVKDSAFLFNTQELQLAALLFEKKMQVFTTDSGVLKKATDPINEHLAGPLTIIHHANLHFERCVPSSLEERDEVNDALNEWNTAKFLAGLQKERDGSIQKRFENLLKDEICTLAWSAAISAGTQNPAWVLGQSARSAIKLWGNHVDPEQQRKELQMLMLLANSSVAKGLGGNPSQLLMSLGIDLWDLGVRPENIKKNEASFRNMGISLVKGVLTLDYKKFAEGILGGALSEGTNRLLETDEKTSTGARILLGLLKNQDAQGILVEKTIASALKKPKIPHKETGIEVEVDPDSESQFPLQVLPEVDEENKPKIQITIEEESKPIAPKAESDTAIPPPIEMHDPEGYKNLLVEGEGLQATLKKLQNDLIIPKITLEKAQKAVNDNQAKIDKYANKGGNSAYKKTLKYKEKGYEKVADRNVAQGNVDKITNKIAEVSGKIAENQKAQLVASSPKHIPAPDSVVHIIGNEKTGKNHHPYYVESGQKQGLGKYDNPEDARYISGLFTKVETNKLSLERQCFGAQEQLVEVGFSIDDIPERPNLSMPTILGNDVDANSKTLNTACANHKKEVQQYLSGLEKLLGNPIETQGLSKSEISQITRQVTPNIKDAKEHGFWYNAWRAPGKGLRWLDDHGVSLSVNVQVSRDLYKTPPPNTTPSRPGVYGPSEPPQIASVSVNAPVQEPSIVQNWGWQGVEAMQQDTVMKTLEQNINANRQTFSGMPQAPIDYQAVWGQGFRGDVQLPPMELSGLGQNEIVPRTEGIKDISFISVLLERGTGHSLKTAGIHGGDYQPVAVKIQSFVVEGGKLAKEFALQRLNDPIQADIDVVLALAKVPGKILKESVQFILNPNFSDDLISRDMVRTIAIVSKTADTKFNEAIWSFNPGYNPDSAASKIAGAAGEFFLIESVFLRAGRAKSLIDRALVRPQGFGQQVRIIEGFQQPALRSGLSFPKLGLMPGQHKLLAERNISQIRTDWVFPKKGGASINGRWYTEHALERMAPRTPEVMAELEVRMLERAAKKGYLPQTEEFGEWLVKNKPNPRNIPPSVVESEIAKPGSTSIRVELNNKGDVVTVIPGGKI